MVAVHGRVLVVSDYKWSQLSQWDVPPDDACIKYMGADTGLSKSTCRYMLVKSTDMGGGYMRSEYVKEQDVSQSTIDSAGRLFE